MLRYALLLTAAPLILASLHAGCKSLNSGKKDKDEVRTRACIGDINIFDGKLWVPSNYDDPKTTFAMSLNDPLNPQVLFQVSTETDGRSTFAKDGYLQVISDGFFRTFQYSDSAPPKDIGFRNYSGQIFGNRSIVFGDTVYFNGNALFAGTFKDGHLVHKDAFVKRDGVFKVEDLAMKGDYIYAIRELGGLEVVDFHKGEKMTSVTNIELDDALRMVISGDYIYLVGTSRDERVSEDEVGLRVVDISKPSEPKLIKSLPIKGRESDIAEWNGRLYISNGTSLKVYDKTDPTNPQLVDELSFAGLVGNSPPTGNILDMAIHPDGIAYLSMLCHDWYVADLRGDHPKVVRRMK